MATKKTWTDADYTNEAREFVACYGVGYNWHEFVEEYCEAWDRTNEFKRPDQDRLPERYFRRGSRWDATSSETVVKSRR